MQSIASRASLTFSQPFKKLASRVVHQFRAGKQRKAMASKQHNSNISDFSQEEQQRHSSETTQTSSSTPPRPANQSTWGKVKATFKTKRNSVSEILKRLSGTSSNGNGGASSSSITDTGPDPKKDKEDSAFCNTLLGLTQRNRRFQYLDFGKEDTNTILEDHEEISSRDTEGRRRIIVILGASAATTVPCGRMFVSTAVDSDDENKSATISCGDI